MITNLAGAAASCTGTWSQRWNCGWKTPSPAVARAGYDFGHNGLVVLAVLFVVILVARAVRKRKKGRASAPATAGARR